MSTLATQAVDIASITNVLSACLISFKRKIVFVMKDGGVYSGHVRTITFKSEDKAGSVVGGTVQIEDDSGRMVVIDAVNVMGVRPD